MQPFEGNPYADVALSDGNEFDTPFTMSPNSNVKD